MEPPRSPDATDPTPPDLGLVPLEAAMPVVPGTSTGHAEVAHAFERTSNTARKALGWMEATDSNVEMSAVSLGDVDSTRLRNVVLRAAAIGHPGLRSVSRLDDGTYRDVPPLRSWTFGLSTVAVPDTLSVRQAEHSGGLLLDNAERWVPEIADFVDHVATGFNAHVRASIVTGLIPVSVLGDGHWEHPVVVSVSGSVTVHCENDEAIELPPGMAVRTGRLLAVEAHEDSAAVIVGLREPLIRDLWEILVNFAGHWPRLRLDVPRNPTLPSRVYGLDTPVDTIDLMQSVLREDLLKPEMAEQCGAWWRANILPAPRPATHISSKVVRGRLPGGFGFVVYPNGVQPTKLAAGGWVLPTFDAPTDLLVALVSGTEIAINDLDDNGVRLVESLVELGLASPVGTRA